MKATLNILHHQGTDWKRELDFYVEELALLTTRLAEFTAEAASSHTLAQAEHFKNKFMRMREQIDTIAKDIKIREQKVENRAMDKPESVDEQIQVANDKIFDHMAALSKHMSETRYQFNQFIAKGMHK